MLLACKAVLIEATENRINAILSRDRRGIYLLGCLQLRDGMRPKLSNEEEVR
jgi:hypothetical protein